MRYSLAAVPVLIVASMTVCWAQTAATKAADPLGPVRTHIKAAQPAPVLHVYRGAGKQRPAPFVLLPLRYTPSAVLPAAAHSATTPKDKQ